MSGMMWKNNELTKFAFVASAIDHDYDTRCALFFGDRGACLAAPDHNESLPDLAH